MVYYTKAALDFLDYNFSILKAIHIFYFKYTSIIYFGKVGKEGITKIMYDKQQDKAVSKEGSLSVWIIFQFQKVTGIGRYR